MNIYLDIDGVLLANDAQVARHVDAFVDCYIAEDADMLLTFVRCFPIPINSL